MTRTVFDNHETAHVWAQNAQDSGRSHNGQFYFSGPALFSYGPHFLAGFILPDGVALLNDDSYSVSTGRRMGYARSATSHRTRHHLADLTEIGAAIAWAARRDGETRPSSVRGYCPDAQAARRDVRAWAVRVLERDGPDAIGPDALAYVLGLVGLARSGDKIRREAARKVEARKAAAQADKERQAANAARLWGSKERADALPDALARILGGERPHHATNWGGPLAYLESLNREALAAQKWTKGRPGFIRDHARIRKARAQVRAAIDTRRAIEGRRVAWGNFKRGAALLRDALAALETGQAPQAGNVAGQVRDHENRVSNLEAGERLHTLEAVTRLCAQVEAKRALALVSTAPTMTPALRAALDTLAGTLDSGARKAADDLGAERQAAGDKAQAERLERERQDREAWQRGETVRGRFGGAYFRTAQGGAYLRAVDVKRDDSGQITGGTLETSQGARVPLTHALRAFRFLKWCRETGTPWQRNGRTVRVGHYQVDSVSPDGTFRAGCHLIEWPQVEALAAALGVADLEADSSVAQERGAA